MPTPAAIKAHLDTEVVGQDQAKEKLAIVAWRHAMQFHATQTAVEYGSRTLMLIGPPGVGKTALIAATARAIGVPYCRVSAPLFVGPGYAGMDFADILRALYEAAGKNAAFAQQGIMQVDQIDQIRIPDPFDSDITVRMTQHNLTRFLQRGRIKESDGGNVIDTTPLLIVLTGSFEGCEWSIRIPAEETLIPRSEGVLPEGEAMSYASVMGAIRYAGQSQADKRRTYVETEDLVHWGYLPEMLNGVDIVPLREMDAVDLLAILGSVRSPIEAFRDLFALWGVVLEVTHGARQALAESACQKGGSAAALDSMLERLLQPSLLELPQLRDRGITHVVVTRESLQAATVDYVHGTPVLPTFDAVLQDRFRRKSNLARQNTISDKSKLKCVKRLKTERLGWAGTAPEIRAWWDAWETRNQNRPDVVLSLVESLAIRGANLELFHTASREAQTESIEALLHYVDYLIARNANPP